MGDFRARDADRDRYVDIIESAYVDGQLGDEDRELRVSRALTAETLDELDALTRDLQNRPPPVVVAPPRPVPAPAPAPASAPARTTPWPVPPKDRTPARVIGFVVAAIFAFAVFSMASADPPPEELDYATVPSDWGGSASVSSYRLTAAGVRTFLRRYEAKFDTMDAYEVRFFPDRVVAHVPVSGSSPRFQQWAWDGIWRRDGQAQPVGASTGPVDLRALDAGALLDSIDVATSGLGVSDAEVQRVVVREASDGQGLVGIHVRNGSTDSALLETTLQGSRVRAVPHEE